MYPRIYLVITLCHHPVQSKPPPLAEELANEVIRYEHLAEAVLLDETQRRRRRCLASEREAALRLERALKREQLVARYHDERTEALCSAEAGGVSEQERDERLRRLQRLHELQLGDFDKLSDELASDCKDVAPDVKDDEVLARLELKVTF